MFKEFRAFAMRGNVIDLAVGIILGAAFSAIVNSLVSDILMPAIGLLVGNTDFSNLFLLLKAGKVPGPYVSLVQAQEAGAVTINYGLFSNTIINFLIITFSVFLLVRAVNRLKPAVKPSTRECPYCLSKIALKATRCPHCTSQLEVA